MSVIDVKLDSPEVYTQSENRLSLSNMPFSGWVVLQLATSSLYPQNYQLRPIEDKGSIAESLTAANIEVLDRVESGQFLFMKALRSVGIFAVGFFTILPAALVGIIYHGSMAVKNLIIPIDKKEGVSTWEKVHKHIKGMLHDMATVAIPVIGAVSLGSRIDLTAAVISSLVFAGMFATAPFNPQIISNWFIPGDNNFFLTQSESYAFHKALILRRQFGLVGSSKGNVLTWNKDKDTDLTRDSVFYDWHLTGYFGKLYTAKGKEFLDAVKQLRNELPKNCKFSILDVWDVDKIINFLKLNRSQTGFSDEQTEQWKQKLCLLHEKMQLVRKVIVEALKLSLPGKNPPLVPKPVSTDYFFDDLRSKIPQSVSN